ncbi:haloalkane dehalogenase [bacterium BMS3Bbin02]|nr:haloalkane dehalogenase [bacterium BMS3Bbin02]
MTWIAVRTPDRAFEGLPDYAFTPHYIEYKGLRLHYLDVGAGDPIVLFHGEPTWSFLYRNVIPPLVAAGHRVIAPDYPGFGRSDKPTDPAFYTYERHSEFIEALLAPLDLKDATAVVQDWGGPIGLRVAVEHQEWFSRLVVMNTGLFTGTPLSEAFMAWRNFVEKTPDLPVRFIMERSMVTTWDDAVLAAYEAPFPSLEYKVGAHVFPLIVPRTRTDPGAAAMRAVVDALGGWSNPTLVMFSTEDPIFNRDVAHDFARLIPGAGEPRFIENAGHFLQEDQSAAVAQGIIDFLASLPDNR